MVSPRPNHTRQQRFSHMYRLLQQQQHCFEKGLIPALQAQLACLSDWNRRDLEQANDDAERWMQAAMKGQTTLMGAMNALGASADPTGWAHLTQQLPVTVRATFQRAIRSLTHLQTHAQQLNDRNGELLAQQKRLLGHLLGQPEKPYAQATTRFL